MTSSDQKNVCLELWQTEHQGMHMWEEVPAFLNPFLILVAPSLVLRYFGWGKRRATGEDK